MDVRFSAEEVARLRMGLYPREMEDKWFVYWEEPWLRMHRSWTGHEIYALRFEEEEEEGGARAVEVRVNGDRDAFSPEPGTDFAAEVLGLLGVLFGGEAPEVEGELGAVRAWSELGAAMFGGVRVGVEPDEVEPVGG